MSGLRVLHVISEMRTGGAEALVIGMARWGRDVGWVSSVGSAGGNRVADLTTAGVPHHDVPLPRRTVRGVAAARAATKRTLTEVDPDIVIAHNVSASLVARLARPAAPILTVFHAVPAADLRNAARILSFASDRVVAVSEATAHQLRAAGLRRVDVTTIRNAVTRPSMPSRRDARAELDLPLDAPVALCVARMEPVKRHDVLLNAWHKLAGTEILLLAGDGSQRCALERRAEPLGERVRFLGNRTDVPTLLAAADATVLTSESEGLPVAILESLAAGRPVVATDVGGVREVLGHGGGTLVAAGDADAIAVALRVMLHDPLVRQEAADIGMSTVSEHHDPAQMMSQYHEVVMDMLGRDRP